MTRAQRFAWTTAGVAAGVMLGHALGYQQGVAVGQIRGTGRMLRRIVEEQQQGLV